MAASWWFKEDTSSRQWSWRTMAADGAIIVQSEPFASYGKAVMDALRHGFQPTADDWSIETAHGIDRFKHGKQDAFIRKGDYPYPVPPRKNPTREGQ